MSRNLDTTFAGSLNHGTIFPVILAMLTFRTKTTYAWTGTGTLVWNGNSYLGIGSVGKMGAINEGIDIKADGTTVTLSGIDPIYQSECLNDIQIGAPAKIWYGHLLNGTNSLIGNPYLVFSGNVDKPMFSVGGDKIAITLALENRMVDHARPTMRRYTTADQHLLYPQDTAFKWVEQLNDLNLIWGQ